MVKLVSENRITEARALQRKLTPIARSIGGGFGITGTESGTGSAWLHTAGCRVRRCGRRRSRSSRHDSRSARRARACCLFACEAKFSEGRTRRLRRASVQTRLRVRDETLDRDCAFHEMYAADSCRRSFVPSRARPILLPASDRSQPDERGAGDFGGSGGRRAGEDGDGRLQRSQSPGVRQQHRDEAWPSCRSGRTFRGTTPSSTRRRSTHSRCPGGYIYITRGILPFLNDEAQLAGVLGHETGHVTARHAAQQYTRSVGGTHRSRRARHLRSGRAALRRRRRAGARRAVPEVRPRRRAAGRSARRPKYAAAGNWDPAGRARYARRRLGDSTRRRGAPGRPQLAGDASRAARAREGDPADRRSNVKAGRTGLVSDRDAMLRAVDGIIYGDNPEQGDRSRSSFIHPPLRLQDRLPERLGHPEQPAAGGGEGAGR